jgi:pimeloyl-ACP methyl ester carboxylesterase
MDHGVVARRVPSTRYAQSDGAKIAFQVSGEGPCDLVFVPGLVSHLDLQWQQLSYRRFVTALGQACRVIRFDKRGTGLSDPTDALPSMDERVVDLAAVMDAAGSQAAVLLGVSDGGRCAVAFAAAHRHPHRGAGRRLRADPVLQLGQQAQPAAGRHGKLGDRR